MAQIENDIFIIIIFFKKRFCNILMFVKKQFVKRKYMCNFHGFLCTLIMKLRSIFFQ